MWAILIGMPWLRVFGADFNWDVSILDAIWTFLPMFMKTAFSRECLYAIRACALTFFYLHFFIHSVNLNPCQLSIRITD
jgi:hypothetical protein